MKLIPAIALISLLFAACRESFLGADTEKAMHHGDAERIFFTEAGPGGASIAAIWSDGGGYRRVCDSCWLAAAPRGTRMAVIVPNGAYVAVAMTDTNGGDRVTIADPDLLAVIDSAVDISPDGSLVAYAGEYGNGKTLLTIARTDGPIVQQLRLSYHGSSSTFTRSPRFSPRGDRLAFVAEYEKGKGVMHMLELATSTVRIIDDTAAALRPGAFGWAGSANRFAYVRARPGTLRSLLILADGDGAALAAVDGGLAYFGLAWAPDGASLAVVRSAPAGGSGEELWRLDAAGNDGQRLYAGGAGLRAVQWSPEGVRVLFGEGSGSTRIVDTRTTATGTISTSALNAYWLSAK